MKMCEPNRIAQGADDRPEVVQRENSLVNFGESQNPSLEPHVAAAGWRDFSPKV